MRISFAVVLLAGGLSTACSSIDDFSVTEEATAEIPRGSLVDMLPGRLGFDEFSNIDTRASQEIANQNVSAEDIDSIRLTDLAIEVTQPAQGQDLAFLQSVQFFVEADGLDRQRIASGTMFPDGATSVDLVVDDVDLEPYVTAEAMTITSEATGSRPEMDTTLTATITLLIDVDVSGVACAIRRPGSRR